MGVTRSAIVGATGTDDDADPRYPAVVLLKVPNDEPGLIGVCSGTLISPNHVLTAAHCVTIWNRRVSISALFGAHPESFGDLLAGTGDPEATRAVADCHMHPNVAEVLGVDPGECGLLGELGGGLLRRLAPWDLAVLQLSEPIPLGWATADFATNHHRLLEPDERPVVGEPVTIVGYGLTGPLGSSDVSSVGYRRWAEIAIAGTGRPEQPLFTTDPLSIVGTSGGDSGGPALWSLGAAVPNRLDPVVAVASLGPVGGSGHTYASLVDAGNVAWVRSMLDLDEDGRYDAVCRGVPVRGSEPGADPINDRDGDGVFNEDDDCPDTYDPCQFDRDGDGVGDLCDSCPDVPNGGVFQTLDSDGDGHSDACDNCPLTPNFDQADHDIPFEDDFTITADGVGDVCDNCPDAINPDQANCNLDAEREQGLIDLPNGLPGVGDACDPVPCPNTGPFETETRVGRLDGLPTTLTAQDVLRVDALSTLPQRARTGFRFCPCSLATADDPEVRRDCRLALPDGTGGCALGLAGDRLYRDPDEPRSWRLMTLAHEAPAEDLSGEGLRREVTLEYAPPAEHFETDLRSTWDQRADERRWETRFPDWQWPRDPGTRLRVDLPGVLWSHAPGPPPAADGTRVDFPLALRLLASHYQSGPVAPPREARNPFECHQFLGPYVGRPAFCPFCAGSFPRPFLGLPGRFRRGRCRLEPLPPAIVLPFDELPAAPGFGPDPGPLLEVEGTWVAAAESDSWLPPQGPRYAALSSDGASLRKVLVETPTGFAEQAPPDPCDNPNGCQDPLLRVAGAVPASLAPPSVGAGLALSSRLHTLYRVGGQDDSGRPLGELWAFDTESFQARQLPLFGVAPGEVLASTYDAASNRLLWLDVVEEPLPLRPPRRRRGHRRPPRVRTRPVVRLVATGPFGGEAVELGRWPRLSRNTRFALAADPAGRLFVVASRERGGWHLVVRLELGRRAVRLDGFAFGPGALVTPQVRADARGVSLVVRRGRRERVVGYASEALWGPFFGGGVFEACF